MAIEAREYWAAGRLVFFGFFGFCVCNEQSLLVDLSVYIGKLVNVSNFARSLQGC